MSETFCDFFFPFAAALLSNCGHRVSARMEEDEDFSLGGLAVMAEYISEYQLNGLVSLAIHKLEEL